MAAHARLKDEFTEDEKYHNVMRWLSLSSETFLEALAYFELKYNGKSGAQAE